MKNTKLLFFFRRELTADYPQPFLAFCNPFAKDPLCVTQVQVMSATGLDPLNINEGKFKMILRMRN